MNYTPRPWQTDDHFSCHSQIKGPKGLIAETVCTRHSLLPLEEIRANAKLMAAAPDLFEALIEARKAMNHHGIVGDPAQFMADEAIAKAQEEA